MPAYTSPRPVVDHATWAPGTSCPMVTRDPYNFPIAASTPHDWYRPRIFVSGCENPANAGSGSSSTGGGSFLYDPAADAWEDIPHFIGMDPSYSVAGTYSHGAATFHPVGPTGTATAGSASGITIDKYLAGNLAVGARIRITGGTGSGQSRTITASSGATRSSGYLPQYRSGSLGNYYPSGGTTTIPVPTGTQPGDLMVTVFFSSQIPVAQITNDPAWTLAYTTWAPGSNFWVESVFYKVAGPSEPANYTWTVPAWWMSCTYWSVVSANFVSATGRYASTTALDTFVWSTNRPLAGHRLSATVLTQSRNGIASTSVNGLASLASNLNNESIYDLRPNGEMASPFMAQPSIAYQNATDSQSGWVNVVAQATGSYTESTVLTVDSPWSVQPDATSTYAIDSGSFWCWRGNASDSTWAWSKYDIARGVWEQKTSTDSVSAPTYINSTVGVDSTFGPNTTFSVPSGTADGDLMVLAITTGQNGATAPAGWTLLGYANSGGGSCSTMYVFYRIASSEPASYSFPRDNTTGGCVATCATYRGAGSPRLLVVNGDNVLRNSVTYSIPNVFQLPAVVASFVQNRADEFYPGQWFSQPISVSDTYRNGSTNSRFGDQVISASAASGTTSFSWIIDPYGTGSKYSWMAWGSVLIPAAAGPGMTNYGKADPSRQGGIHATTDDSDYIWLGGDAQTSLRRYSISGDSWSASAAHTPYTRPMRNIGGGMVMVKDLPGWADNGRYIFYVCPAEVSNVYDPVGRVYAYDTQTDAWFDLLADPLTVTPPGQFCQVGSVNGRMVWNTPASRKVYVHRPDRIDSLVPEDLLAAPARGSMATMGCSMHPLTILGERYLYVLEHTNSQEITPFRTRLKNIAWAGG